MKRYKRASDIKVGVVGYGGAFNMGRVHLQEMQKAGMTPTAIAEIDPARLAVATQDFPGIETYSSLPAMLKKSKVDLITIITPHNTHAPLALRALKAGRHVVCEKPMAITTGECDAMIAAAKKAVSCSPPIIIAIGTARFAAPSSTSTRTDRRRGSRQAHWGARSETRDWWRTS